jgi:hypothetical protein
MYIFANNSYRRALRSWTIAWQHSPEANLDPLNKDSPIPFTSTALLGLVYCRICLDSGPYRVMETRNPQLIARNLIRIPALGRGGKLIHALLHATHSLSIAVNLGVEYVSRSQGFFWSIQHALCCFELAILVHKWLCELASSGSERIQDGKSPCY